MNRIDRRRFLHGLGAATALAGVAGSIGAGHAAARPASRAPDIIFILADDLGYGDLSCTGSHHIRTPAIDSIARDGVQLRQGYASAPICSPTRTALLTGCYRERFAVGVEEPLGPNAQAGIGVPADRPTIASVLQQRGYHTALIGKWHLGEPPEHGPLQHGYDEFLGIVQGAADYFRHHIIMNGQPVDRGLHLGDAPVERPGYITDLFGDEAVRQIEHAGDKPLFLSLHFNAPHWPWEGREDAALAEKVGSSFHYDGGSLAKYREMVEIMDQNVAKVLAALKRMGRADNAIVIFTSDNGGERFSETWPFIGYKGELLEGGIRVPVVMRWPGHIARGSTSDQVMATMDYLPTLLAMAGGKAAPGVFDGMDLSAHLLGKAAPVERTLFWRFKANEQAAIRKGNWKYLKLGGKEHLFNLAEDEHERAERGAAYPELMASLRQEWSDWNAQMLPYPPTSFTEQVKNAYQDRY